MTREVTENARVILRSHWFWIITIGTAALCAYSGPFGTFETFDWPERIVYWTAIAVVTGVAGVWVSEFTRVADWPVLPHVLLASCGFGLVTTCFVTLLQSQFDPSFTWASSPPEMVLMVFPVATVIFLAANRFMQSKSDTPVAKKPLQAPKIFARLQSQADATEIISLTASDHYVEVTTDKGTELCLLRFADAIAETLPVQGVQIHRSHWVALHAIDRIVSNSNKPQVVLKSGPSLPVSRARVKKLRSSLEEFKNGPSPADQV